MALKFGSGGVKKAAPAAVEDNKKTGQTDTGAGKPSVKETVGKPPEKVPEEAKVKKPSFLKTGKAAQTAQDVEKKKQDEAKNAVRRFWLMPEKDGRVTFLSGNVVDGVLDAPMWYEHNLYKNGRWGNHYICVNEEEPCPMCQAGDRPTLMAGFTVIDHGKYEATKGKNKGKVYQDELRLLAVPPKVFKLLQKKAVKCGGLVGATFDVSRTDANASRVGDDWDYLGTHTIEEIKAEYETKDKIIAPYDLSEVLIYRTAEELITMGCNHIINPDKAGSSGGGHDYSSDL